jgi:TonB-linked SusC/RagA family outer membrane protein
MTNSTICTKIFLYILLASCWHTTVAQDLFTNYASNQSLPRGKRTEKASEQQMKGNITLQLDSATLQQILERIESQSKYVFIYTNDEIPLTRRFSVNVVNKPIDIFLSEFLPPLKISHKLYGKQIVLKPSARPSGSSQVKMSSEEPATYHLPEAVGKNEMQTEVIQRNQPVVFVVKGVVTDEIDSPLPGVNVLEKGTTNGTVTDVNGAYTLEVSNGNSSLVFSYIGYRQQEVLVNSQSTVSIKMDPDVSTLSEVVVIGYGEQKRSDLTGAIAPVKSEDIKNLPVTSVANAIQGRVAGVYVTAANGQPGSAPNITIRGPGNLNGVGPLYVVDGMPFFGTGFNFNIQDIESMEVIKDASAAAIYGSQASGGVILIKTKRGRSQRIKAGFNSNIGSRHVFNLPDLLNRDQYIQAQIANGVPASSFNAPSTYPNTNWFKELYKPALEQNYTAYLNGGGEKSTFYSSVNYQNVKGVMIDNGIQRYTLRLNSEHKLNERLSVGQTLYGTYTNENPPSIPNNGPVNFRSSPLVPVYDKTNPTGGWGRDYLSQKGNPIGDQYVNYVRGENYDLNAAVYFNWEIVKRLHFRTNAGIAVNNNNSYYFNYRYDFGATQRSVETFGRTFGNSRAMLINYTLDYNKTFGDHDVKGLLGYEARREKNASLSGNAYYPLGDLAQNSQLSSADTLNRPSFSGSDNFRILSQFARIDYSFKGKYLAQVNVRRDGVSTVFGPNNKFGVFPSMSLGWKITDENFMASLPQFTNLKLRASYGKLGNYQGIPYFLYSQDYSSGFSSDFGGGKINGITLSNKLVNTNIKWESILTTNVGLDIGLLNNNLSLSLDWYNRTTKDMLYQLPLAPSAGLGTSIYYNIGEMNNRGFEFLVDYKNQVGDFSYNISVNGAFNRNKLVTLSSAITEQQILNGELNEVYSFQKASRSIPGKPLGQFWGYKVDGIYKSDEPQGPKFNDQTPKAGDLIYRDVNNDGFINDKDNVFIGNPWPKFTYGMTLSGAWKGIDVRIFFVGVQGVDVYNATQSFEYYFYNDYNTTPKIFQSSQFNGNGITDIPRSDLRNWGFSSSYHIQNGSYLRLKNLQIGYSFPSTVLNKIRTSSLRIFVMTDNLLTFTKYKGIDPESALSGSVQAKGIDSSTYRYPLSRMYSIGLNVEF